FLKEANAKPDATRRFFCDVGMQWERKRATSSLVTQIFHTQTLVNGWKKQLGVPIAPASAEIRNALANPHGCLRGARRTSTIHAMRVAMAQLNPIVGDVSGNTALVLEAVRKARRAGADLVVTSELALIGYPPRDLLWREGIVEACERAVAAIAHEAGELAVVVGHPRRSPAPAPS